MNLRIGGDGGFFNLIDVKKGREKCDEILLKKYGKNFRSIITKNYFNNLTTNQQLERNNKIKNGLNLYYKTNNGSFKGKKHNNETKRKIGLANSITQKGEKNSQFGKPRSEETKKKIKESILKGLGIIDGVSIKEKKKLKRDEEIIKYTINGIFYSIRKRNMIKNIFNIDMESNPELKILELKTLLSNLYKEKKSTFLISKIFNTSDETIRKYLIFFNIERKKINNRVWGVPLNG